MVDATTNWVGVAVKLVAPFEGFERVMPDGLIYPYLDKLAKPNVWTRGAGRTYGIAMDSPAITKQEAHDELVEGVRAYGMRCAALAPVLLQHPNKLAAITSWAWNCGTGAFKVSRLRKAILREDWATATQLILKPDTAGGVVYRGLVRRRAAEAALFSR